MSWRPFDLVVESAVKHCRAGNQSYIRFSPVDGKYKGKMAAFVIYRKLLDPLGWEPGVSKVSIEIDDETKRLLLTHNPNGRLLQFDGGLDKEWCRLHCPEKLALLLRQWLQIDPTKKTHVALNLEIQLDSVVVAFGTKLEYEKKPVGTASAKTTVSVTPASEKIAHPLGERMLKWFEYDHLQQPLKKVSSYFFVLAQDLCASCEPGPERTVALRKLLEAKDAAVRARLHPGG
jgi:hypothetical protein